MKTAIVTNALYKQPPAYLEYTDELKRRYCEKWGITYERTALNPHPGLHSVFSKFAALRQAIKKDYDWLVWMDCDAAPVTLTADLNTWLSTQPEKVIMLKDALGWNAGVFAVPVCTRSIEWLDWLDKTDNLIKFDSGYRDQDEMAYTFKTTHKNFINDTGYDFGFNHYDDLYTHKDKPNLFVEGKSWCLHIPGYNDTYREERFGNIIRGIKGLPPRHKAHKEKLEEKTVTDYINEGAKKILINYPHGLGDLIMFYPHFKAFCKEHPDCQIDLKAASAFQELLPPVEAAKDYDLDIWFPARFNERDKELKGLTKPEANVKYDLGSTYNPELDYTDPIVPPIAGSENSGLVGVNFHCSCYPNMANCPESTAQLIWSAIYEAGLTPIETYVAKVRRSENNKYHFVKLSMRDLGLGIRRVMDTLASLRGMASVSTGTFHYGMAAYPHTTLYLKNSFDAACYTAKPVLSLDVNHPDRGVIKEWVARLKHER